MGYKVALVFSCCLFGGILVTHLYSFGLCSHFRHMLLA